MNPFENLLPISAGPLRVGVRELNADLKRAAEQAERLAEHDWRFAVIGISLAHAATEAGRIHFDHADDLGERPFDMESGDCPLAWAPQLVSRLIGRAAE
jgi:hypothetical protein